MPEQLDFLPEALSDIESARDWYADTSDQLADRFLLTLEHVLREVELSPERGAFHDEQRVYRYRRVHRFPYLIVYRDFFDRVLVVALYHTSRKPGEWKERLPNED